MPAKLPLQYAVALKPGVGLDYWEFRTPDEPKSTPYKLAPDHSTPLNFILNGTRTVTVRVVDEQDKPLRGVTVYPWLVKKPNKGADGDELNLSGLSNFNRQTNDQGIATFDFIPSDNIGHLIFWTTLEGYYSPRNEFDPASNKSEVLAKLTPLVKVTGRVTLPDGKPAQTSRSAPQVPATRSRTSVARSAPINPAPSRWKSIPISTTNSRLATVNGLRHRFTRSCAQENRSTDWS